MKKELFTALLAVALGATTNQSFARGGGAGPRGGLCAPLTSFDTDGDGTVSVEEFTAANAAHVAALQEALLETYDTDDDGNVTLEEVTARFAESSANSLDDVLERFRHKWRRGDHERRCDAEVARPESAHRPPGYGREQRTLRRGARGCRRRADGRARGGIPRKV